MKKQDQKIQELEEKGYRFSRESYWGMNGKRYRTVYRD